MTPADQDPRVAALLDFIDQYPTRPVDRQSASWVVGEIGLSQGNLVDLLDGDQRFMVAVLFANMDNTAAAAELFVLGYRPSLGTAEQLDEALAWAEAKARTSPAQCLEVSILPVLSPLEAVLRSRSYQLEYRLLTMHLGHVTSGKALAVALPGDLAWADLTEENVVSTHDCYRRAFAGTSGMQIPDLELFRSTILKAEHRPRVLLSGDRVVAFSRVAWHDEQAGRGEIRAVARDPDFDRKGLGQAALLESLRSLEQLGSTSACLEVASDNGPAVGLYEKFGFQTQEVAEVFRREL
jgi:ribosomal protein S18 acetylase RimI-like enzyme